MDNQTYQNCLEQVARIERALTNLEQLGLIAKDYAGPRINYSEAIENLIDILESQGTPIKVRFKPESPKQIPIQSQ